MLHEVRGGVFLAVRGLGPPCRSGQLTRLWMYPGHVAGLKRLHRSAAITIVLSKDSQQRKQGHGGGREHRCAASRGGGKGPFWGRWPFAEEWFPLSASLFLVGGRWESFPAPSQE